MKTTVWSLLACTICAVPIWAQDARPDLRSPKPETNRAIRILLYVTGSPRLIDYPDVHEIVACDHGQITFETQDGFVVTHQGPFTVIQQKTTFSQTQSNPRGVRFFDPK